MVEQEKKGIPHFPLPRLSDVKKEKPIGEQPRRLKKRAVWEGGKRLLVIPYPGPTHRRRFPLLSKKEGSMDAQIVNQRVSQDQTVQAWKQRKQTVFRCSPIGLEAFFRRVSGRSCVKPLRGQSIHTAGATILRNGAGDTFDQALFP